MARFETLRVALMEARVDALLAEIDKLDEVGASGLHKILALAHDAGNHEVVVNS